MCFLGQPYISFSIFDLLVPTLFVLSNDISACFNTEMNVQSKSHSNTFHIEADPKNDTYIVITLYMLVYRGILPFIVVYKA